MQKALIIGKTGQVGWELRRMLPAIFETTSLEFPEIDLSSPSKTIEKLSKINFDVLINAAAYNAVDKAEQEPELAMAINGESPAAMAEYCANNKKLFLTYSTDFVFDGTKQTPYTETDVHAPLSVYGKSKSMGETCVNTYNAGIALRVSWVFASRADNFLLKILKLAETKSELKVVNDQIGTPTSAKYIAASTLAVLAKLKNLSFAEQQKFAGVYNLVADGFVSRYDFASLLLSTAKTNFMCKHIHSVPTSEFITPAARPLMSKLNNAKIKNTFDINAITWQEGLQLTLEELGL